MAIRNERLLEIRIFFNVMLFYFLIFSLELLVSKNNYAVG